jgi:NOL1/NOP2/fmu family ribosome biogenesis protein
MQIKKVLNEREIEEIEAIIEKNYGCKAGLHDYKVFVTGEEKIWVISKDIDFGLFDVLKRCYRIGIYFGKLKRNGKIKLSIEGAIIVGRNARRNIVVVSEEEAKKFMQGYNVKAKEMIDAELHNFVLVKCKDDFIGVGILREGYVENLVPKARRLVKLEGEDKEKNEQLK